MKKFFSLPLLIAVILLMLLPVSFCSGADSLSFGGNFRLYQEFRHDMFDRNTRSLKDEDFLRFSTSVWGRWNVDPDLTAYIKVSNESKYFLDSASPDNRNFKLDEIFIENLFVDAKAIGSAPVDVKIGRQDMVFGDGLVVYGGTANDRDRSKYFNAIRTTWRLTPDNSIDFVYVNEPKVDEFLPLIYSADNTGPHYQDHKRIVTASDEQGVIVYSKNNGFEKRLVLEPYYVFKREDRISAAIPELDLHTLGSRGVYETGGWKATGELAYQFGEYDGGRRRTGYGGSLFLSRRFADVLWKPRLEAGYIHFSGDDPNTTAHEGWNPVFSRWTWLMKFYTVHYMPETGYGSYWTNLQLYRTTARLELSPETNLFFSYNYLRANERTKVTGASAAFLSNEGKERGHLVQTRLSHSFTSYLDAFLAFEYFAPGDFYKLRDDELMLYWQLQLKLG